MFPRQQSSSLTIPNFPAMWSPCTTEVIRCTFRGAAGAAEQAGHRDVQSSQTWQSPALPTHQQWSRRPPGLYRPTTGHPPAADWLPAAKPARGVSANQVPPRAASPQHLRHSTLSVTSQHSANVWLKAQINDTHLYALAKSRQGYAILTAKGHTAAATYQISLVHARYSLYFTKLLLPLGDQGPSLIHVYFGPVQSWS